MKVRIDRSKIGKDPENFKKIVQESKSIAEVIRKLNYSVEGSIYNFIKGKIKEYNLSMDHFTGQGWSKGKTRDTNKSVESTSKKLEYPLELIFIENSLFYKSALLRKLLKYKYKDYICENCNAKDWMGDHLTLHVHHINGIDTDHRLENLLVLCGNCHNQVHYLISLKCKNDNKIKKIIKRKEDTRSDLLKIFSREEFIFLYEKNTIEEISKIKNIPYSHMLYLKKYYGIKTTKKHGDVNRPHKRKFNTPKEELQKLVYSMPILRLAKLLGVSNTAVAHRCERLGIKKPKRGYWAKIEAGKL